MISLSVKIVDQELLVNLETLPRRLHEAVKSKLESEIALLRTKVEENLSGKVLNSKTGALLSSLVSGVEQLGSLLIGFVAVESSDPKVEAYAMAHEYGGKGYYEIVPVHKAILRFETKGGNIVFAPYVYHPPAAERSYLRSALHEMQSEIEAGLSQAIQDAMVNQ